MSKEKKSVTILDAICYITAVWEEVTRETVQNCFKKAGFMLADDDDYLYGVDAKVDAPFDKMQIRKFYSIAEFLWTVTST